MVGALIVSRQPSHPIGWVLCAFGVLGGVGGFASEYAIYGLRSHPGAVPEAAALAWFASWVFALELALLTALLLLFRRPTAIAPLAMGAVAGRHRSRLLSGRGAVDVAATRDRAATGFRGP